MVSFCAHADMEMIIDAMTNMSLYLFMILLLNVDYLIQESVAGLFIKQGRKNREVTL